MSIASLPTGNLLSTDVIPPGILSKEMCPPLIPQGLNTGADPGCRQGFLRGGRQSTSARDVLSHSLSRPVGAWVLGYLLEGCERRLVLDGWLVGNAGVMGVVEAPVV